MDAKLEESASRSATMDAKLERILAQLARMQQPSEQAMSTAKQSLFPIHECREAEPVPTMIPEPRASEPGKAASRLDARAATTYRPVSNLWTDDSDRTPKATCA
eukprot:4315435-Amphidinium_carterae.1